MRVKGTLLTDARLRRYGTRASTHTIISQSVVEACELQPTGMVILLEGVGDGG